jgi:hypothetical protein
MSVFLGNIAISKKIQLFLNTIFKTLQRVTAPKKDLLPSEAFTPQIFSDSFCIKTQFYISSLYIFLLLNVQNKIQKESAFLNISSTNAQILKNKGNRQ